MPLIKLTPDQHLSLRNALLAAFPNSRRLSELLLSIGQNYDMHEVPSYDLTANVRVLIKAAESEDWLLRLVLKARDTVPLDPAFQQLSNEFAGLAPASTISEFGLPLDRQLRPHRPRGAAGVGRDPQPAPRQADPGGHRRRQDREVP